MTSDSLTAFAQTPRLATAILWAASRDEAMVVEHLVGLGRRDAVERLAHYLLEPGAKLTLVGMGSKAGYACPLNQNHLADALGLTAVHVNRVLRHLREQGLVTFHAGLVTFDDKDTAGSPNPFRNSVIIADPPAPRYEDVVPHLMLHRR